MFHSKWKSTLAIQSEHGNRIGFFDSQNLTRNIIILIENEENFHASRSPKNLLLYHWPGLYNDEENEHGKREELVPTAKHYHFLNGIE
jgi:hypothetical protein